MATTKKKENQDYKKKKTTHTSTHGHREQGTLDDKVIVVLKKA